MAAISALFKPACCCIIFSASDSSSSGDPFPGVPEFDLSLVPKSCHAMGCCSFESEKRLSTLSVSSHEWKLEPTESRDEREELARGVKPREGKELILKGDEGGFCLEDRLLPPFLGLRSMFEKVDEMGERWEVLCVGVPERGECVDARTGEPRLRSGRNACGCVDEPIEELAAEEKEKDEEWLKSNIGESGRAGERNERGPGLLCSLVL